jgi:hypothetical protein
VPERASESQKILPAVGRVRLSYVSTPIVQYFQDRRYTLDARVTEIVPSQLSQLGALSDELLRGQVFLF